MRIQNSFSLNMILESYKSLGILGLGFHRVVNSDDPSNDCASLQLYYSCRKASQEPQPSSKQPVAEKIFRQPLLRRVDTPPGSLEPKLPTDAKISSSRSLTRLHAQVHTPPQTGPCASVVPHVPARGSFSGRRTSPPELPVDDLQAYVPGFLIQHLHHPLFSIFLFGDIYF